MISEDPGSRSMGSDPRSIFSDPRPCLPPAPIVLDSLLQAFWSTGVGIGSESPREDRPRGRRVGRWAGVNSKYLISLLGCAVNDHQICDRHIKIHNSTWLLKSLKASDLNFTNAKYSQCHVWSGTIPVLAFHVHRNCAKFAPHILIQLLIEIYDLNHYNFFITISRNAKTM